MEEIRCRSSVISKHWSALNAFHQRRRHSRVTHTSAQPHTYTRRRKHTNASKSNFAYYNFRDVSCITSDAHMCIIHTHTHTSTLTYLYKRVVLRCQQFMLLCVCVSRLQRSMEKFSFTLASFPYYFCAAKFTSQLKAHCTINTHTLTDAPLRIELLMRGVSLYFRITTCISCCAFIVK